MKRMELMQRYLEQKHRTTLVHEQYLNTQREYAPGTALYMREIHFLVALGPDGPASVSSLAQKLEVTLGAVSQMAARLEKRAASPAPPTRKTGGAPWCPSPKKASGCTGNTWTMTRPILPGWPPFSLIFRTRNFSG